jgi:hypothetical protein
MHRIHFTGAKDHNVKPDGHGIGAEPVREGFLRIGDGEPLLGDAAELRDAP